jgi:hypothetical protein
MKNRLSDWLADALRRWFVPRRDYEELQRRNVELARNNVVLVAKIIGAGERSRLP